MPPLGLFVSAVVLRTAADLCFRAAVVRTPAGPDSIEITDLPVTGPGAGQVRVEIVAAPVNPVDLAVVNGLFHSRGLVDQPEHTGLGWDFSGTVVAVAPGADLAVGARVAGRVAGFDRDFGTYAEQLIASVADVAVVPDSLDLVAAATVPLNGLAAAGITGLLGDAPEGRERLLVTGAAGAVGGYVAALARDQGWRVTGLAGAEDEAFVPGLGPSPPPRRSPAGTRSLIRRRCRRRAWPWSATAEPTEPWPRAACAAATYCAPESPIRVGS
ncbi:MAG: hypothetical protein JK586_13490 [Nocardiopsis sp. BM-2018]|nr:MAG: hypothetical protein JK586_13490 [Nocardiopsis sp. BM-2018]